MEDYPEPLDLSLPSVKLKNRQSLSDIPLDLSKKRIDNPQIMQMGPFSNSIMKNIPNFSCDKRPRAHQSSGASSLSYINQSPKPRNAHSCIPVRNPYPDNYEDELESVETPFNFSSRYAETKNITNGQNIDRSSDNYKEKKIENKNENFTMYAETDLDQPTDYSLRYAENNRESDSEVSDDDDEEDDDSDDNEEKTAASEFVGDTVKTYCTEGTPYETPFNFSTSTSMSDLRISEKGAVDVDTQGRKTKIQENIPENDKNDKNSGEKITHNRSQTPKMKSEFNSGLTSPEKPMNYCEEGTPGYFSRVSSFGSLNSAAAGSGEEKSSEEKDKCSDQMKTPKKNKLHQKLPGSEVKVVKFENSINYCEETPLMFSRSSSLGSVGSIEQSMHDEGSSVVSDFSRLTSGIISPSEIPDSPTQTVPPSPKQRKSDLGLNMRRHSSARRSLPTKSSVFEDGVTKFKEENTPAQFSLATSLSSLNIDDHDANQGELNGNCANGSINNEENVVIINVDDSSSEDEEDEVSFHNNRENIQNRDFSLSGNRQFQSNLQDSKSPVYAERSKLFSTRALPPPSPSDNNVRCYNTEDTPAVLSRNESISELSLSTLSILDEEPTSNRAYLSENSSAGSVDNRVNKEQRSEERNGLNDVWARKESTQKPDSNQYRQFDNLPPFLESKDEYCKFAVEDSPAQFSLRSSLSHLTMESDIPSGILDFSLPKETPESPNNVHDNHSNNTSQESPEHVPNAEVQEEESSDLQNVEETDISSEKVPTIICPNEEENVNVSNENSKSIEMKFDDSRCNSMKKKKWKWKWQFGSEDGQHSESGESALTDKQSSSNIEEFDQGRRSKIDKNSGSLDASFRKKKWWKWKFGSKEKEHINVEEAVDKVKDETQAQTSNDLEEKDTNSKEDGTLETRNNKSKRWKWKWKLGFKDDDSSKSEKCSLGLSKLKHHVSPETSKEPITIADVLHSADVPKEMNSLIRFLPEKQTVEEIESKEIRVCDEPVIKLPVPIREKLATPEPSDSDHSVIIEEINEHYSSDEEEPSENNNAVNSIYRSDNTGTYHDNIIAEAKPNYEISLDEYIQLGMPKNKIPTKAPISRISPNSEINKDNIKPNNLKDFLEECIQLGLPKNKVPSKVSVSSNHSLSLRNSPKLTSGHFKTESNHVVGANQYSESSGNVSNHTNPALRNASRLTNFESSSLNRLSLDKMRKKEFNSNDNILTGLSKQSSDRLKNVRGPTYGKVDSNNAHGYVRTASNTNKVPTKADDLTDGKIGQREVFNSQLNRTVSKILDSSSSSSRSDTFLPMPKMDAASGHKDTSLKSMYPSNSGKKPDYASVIEECIQLGMPKRKDSSKEIISPTSLIHQKMMHGKRWPEYVSRIANENKCSSLPKPSSNRPSQNYCASDEEFSASDLQIKRDMILRHTMDNNSNRNTFTKAKVPERKQERPFYAQPKSEFKENVPVKYNTTRNTQRMEEFIDSVYSNVDEPKNYSNPSNKELYSRGSTTDRMNRQQAELSSKRGEVGLEDTSNLIDDCIKLGIPIKKLQEIRRSVGRSSSQEILKKYDINEDITQKADSEDDAVYANTTERYSSFKNQGKTHRMTERNEKPLNPKCYDVREASISPILPDTFNKNWKNNLRTETTGKIPKKAETAVDPLKNPDFAAIIEECIQLGMPKRKEFSGEMLNSNLSLASSNSRSNSAKRFPDYPSNVSVESHRSSTLPKNSTHGSNSQNYYSSNEDFSRPGSQRKTSTKQHLMNTSGTYGVDKSLSNIPQKDPSRVSHNSLQTRLSPRMDSTSPAHVPNYHLEMNKTTSQISDHEESMYVNVTNRSGYSRSTSRQSPSIDIMSLPGKSNVSYKSNYSKIEEPDYSAVLEECIKLGMPRRKFNEAQRYLQSLNSAVPDPEEGSMKYGSPNSMDSDDMQLYVNTSIVKDSISERGLDRRPRVSLPPTLRNDIEKLDINSSTIEKALEECIQLGWPKRRENGKDPPAQFSTSPPTETYMQKPTEKSVSKNVNVASVVRNMQTQLACSKQASMTAGAEVNSELQNVSMTDVEEILTDKKNGYEENNLKYSSIDNKSSIYSDDNHAESEMSFASLADIDVKLLDPQIVLQSLEKYTEKLISEAELIINSKSIKV